MSRHSAAADRSPVHHRARQSGRRWIGLAGVIAAAVAGFTALASPASAHDAPPKGTATCASYGPTYTWQVADGSTRVENTGGAAWKVTFATSGGTISPGAAVTGAGDTANGPSFTVSNIPSTAASIKITTTTHWGTAPNYTAGTYDISATINRPAGCDQSVAVPGAPTVTDPTCSTVGSLAVPADTASVKWTTSPAYTSGDTGAFTVTATAQSGYHFSDGKTVETYPVNVAPKTTGTTCDTVIVPVAPAVTQATCTGSTPVPAKIVAATTDHVTYTIAPKAYKAGDTVAVIADSAPGYKFGNSQGDLPAGWTYVSPTEATESVKLADAPVCPTQVAPAAPTIAQSACTGPGTHSSATLTIPSTTGVLYTVDGKDVSGQTLTEQPNSSLTVIAKPAAGFLFDGVQEVDYHETFSDAGDCLVLVTPVGPTSTDGACTTPGHHSEATVTVPSTPHVVYSVNGTDVSGQTLTEPVNSVVTVVATPAAGYEFSGAQSVSTVLTLADPGDCLVSATPAVPSITQAVCTGPGTNTVASLVIPTTLGVIYQIDGKDVSGTIAEPKATTVTVTAVPVDGYSFAAGTTTSWVEDFTDVGGCLVGIAVAKPGFSDDVCTTNKPVGASYTIPSSKNVSYEVNGSPVTAGTHSATDNSTITVTATADSGYSFSGAASSWTHKFGATPGCHAKDSTSVHKPTTVVKKGTDAASLASTGVPTATLVLGGSVILLLGIVLLLAGGVRGRKTRS